MKKYFSLIVFILVFPSITYASDNLVCSKKLDYVQATIEHNNLELFPNLNTHLKNTLWAPMGHNGPPFHITTNSSGSMLISVYRGAEGSNLGNPVTIGFKLCPTGDGQFHVIADLGLTIDIEIKNNEFFGDEEIEDGSQYSVVYSTRGFAPLIFSMSGVISGDYEMVGGYSAIEKEMIDSFDLGSSEHRTMARQELVDHLGLSF